MSRYTPGSSTKKAGNPGNTPVMFSMQDAQRINRAVSVVEKSRRPDQVSELPRSVNPSVGLRTANFTGVWNKGQDLNLVNGGETYTVKNILADAGSSGSNKCIFGRGSDELYYLIAAECSQ
jgi:hypothetical protein